VTVAFYASHVARRSRTVASCRNAWAPWTGWRDATLVSPLRTSHHAGVRSRAADCDPHWPTTALPLTARLSSHQREAPRHQSAASGSSTSSSSSSRPTRWTTSCAGHPDPPVGAVPWGRGGRRADLLVAGGTQTG